jgi:two-component system, response regulator YesN
MYRKITLLYKDSILKTGNRGGSIMYKLIIADDEQIIREGLKDLINWSDLDIEVVEIFSDGQEVIEYLEYMQGDIILTDIRMTNISGIDVARYVYENGIDCRVVFISGFKEFDLALQAMKYGVNDYIIKPTTIDSVLETFTKIKASLDEKSKQREQDQVERERFNQALPLLKDKFFTDLVLGVVDSEEYIRKRMSLIYPQFDLSKSYCILADLTIRDFDVYFEKHWEYSYDEFEMNIANFFNSYEGDMAFHIVYKYRGMFEVFGLSVTNSSELVKLEKHSLDGLLRFIYELSSNFGFEIKYEIKKVFGNIFGVLDYRDTILSNRIFDKKEDQYLQEQKKMIMSNISSGSIVTAQKIFQKALEELKYSDASYRNNYIVDVFSTMNEVIKNANFELSEKIQGYFNYRVLLSLGSTEEAKAYCDRIFDRIRLLSGKTSGYDTNSIINKAKQYIQENITRDISQEETANHLYICSAYLCRIFKKQTGENFTQYVVREKINKAIELLRDPKNKSYKVGEYLGYKTASYFSKVFKAQTGLNPSEYRSRVLNIGGESDEGV